MYVWLYLRLVTTLNWKVKRQFISLSTCGSCILCCLNVMTSQDSTSSSKNQKFQTEEPGSGRMHFKTNYSPGYYSANGTKGYYYCSMRFPSLSWHVAQTPSKELVFFPHQECLEKKQQASMHRHKNVFVSAGLRYPPNLFPRSIAPPVQRSWEKKTTAHLLSGPDCWDNKPHTAPLPRGPQTFCCHIILCKPPLSA